MGNEGGDGRIDVEPCRASMSLREMTLTVIVSHDVGSLAGDALALGFS